MIFVGTCNEEVGSVLVQRLMESSDTELEQPMARLLSLGLGLLFIGKNEQADAMMEVRRRRRGFCMVDNRDVVVCFLCALCVVGPGWVGGLSLKVLMLGLLLLLGVLVVLYLLGGGIDIEDYIPGQHTSVLSIEVLGTSKT